MRGQIKGLNQASRNSQDGISYIQTAEGALTEVSEMLVRMKKLTVQRANGTYNTDDINNINLELSSLKDEINNIIDNTNFNGKNVFKGAVDITVTQDAGQKLSIAVASLDDLTNLGKTITTTTTWEKVDDTDPDNPVVVIKTNDEYNGLSEDEKKDYTEKNTNTASGTSSASNMTTALVEKAITAVNTQRATYGSQQNRLEHTIKNLNITAENLTAAESRIRDVDMASEMMTFSKNNILQQAAQAMLAQDNQAPQGVLQLLR